MVVENPDGRGIHERATSAALSLLDAQPRVVPTMLQISEASGVPEPVLHEMFSDPCAVYEAAAEQALIWLHDACVREVVKVDPENAVEQFAALGDAYIDWASQHRAHFLLISDNDVIRLVGNPRLQRYHDSMRELMERMLERARDNGNLAQNEDIPAMVMSSRVFAYGLARMIVDGRLAEWYPSMPEMEAAKLAMHDFLRRFARGSRSTKKPDAVEQ